VGTVDIIPRDLPKRRALIIPLATYLVELQGYSKTFFHNSTISVDCITFLY
jgi:hypothetical protein